MGETIYRIFKHGKSRFAKQICSSIKVFFFTRDAKFKDQLLKDQPEAG